MLESREWCGIRGKSPLALICLVLGGNFPRLLDCDAKTRLSDLHILYPFSVCLAFTFMPWRISNAFGRKRGKQEKISRGKKWLRHGGWEGALFRIFTLRFCCWRPSLASAWGQKGLRWASHSDLGLTRQAACCSQMYLYASFIEDEQCRSYLQHCFNFHLSMLSKHPEA